mmetsp:Transcript_7196/g.9642  ORF Transcript_7196/g.9642 Transcript_7196/m.9642 type:complete len:841 (+) Transcript_7196:34-2556(+)|eukprot:CAMPEP_0117744922 /NCGR_PEP_ID=MMETSP0947-20121206/7050_1 /TAXON_ID=44440 /ORGANISM="Chattonella subsalsa, Strain CCMP2191" /LENGTH=840 /DNA_ID=CAMNT_0005561969 /DNA_START=424 /DNA_END=2946 /DNA_ORIENTATION=+
MQQDLTRYDIGKVLRQEPIGCILSATLKEKQLPVALKTFEIGEGRDQEAIAEAMLLHSRGRHIALVHCYEAFIVHSPNSGPPVFYLSMELNEHGSLRDQITDSMDPLPEVLIITRIFQIASALSCLHSLGIAHKAVQTRNIFLVHRDPTSDVKLGNFMSPSDYARTQLTVTAPQCFQISEQSCKADIWGLGCVMLEMMTGILIDSSIESEILLNLAHDKEGACQALSRKFRAPYSATTQKVLYSLLHPDALRRPTPMQLGELLMSPESPLSQQNIKQCFQLPPKKGERVTASNVQLGMLIERSGEISELDGKSGVIIGLAPSNPGIALVCWESETVRLATPVASIGYQNEYLLTVSSDRLATPLTSSNPRKYTIGQVTNHGIVRGIDMASNLVFFGTADQDAVTTPSNLPEQPTKNGQAQEENENENAEVEDEENKQATSEQNDQPLSKQTEEDGTEPQEQIDKENISQNQEGEGVTDEPQEASENEVCKVDAAEIHKASKNEISRVDAAEIFPAINTEQNADQPMSLSPLDFERNVTTDSLSTLDIERNVTTDSLAYSLSTDSGDGTAEEKKGDGETGPESKKQKLQRFPEYWVNFEANDPSKMDFKWWNRCQYVDVDQSSSDWKKMEKKIKEALPNACLFSLQRIQHPLLWSHYDRQWRLLSLKNSGQCNEKWLFHGTSTTSPEDILRSEEGLDNRLSRNGSWGRGIYFAESAGYSAPNFCFQKTDDSGNKFYQFFCCRVALGRSKEFSQYHMDLTLPPYLSDDEPDLKKDKGKPENIIQGHVRYDSVTGVSQGSNVFVVYKSDQVYPEYLITLQFADNSIPASNYADSFAMHYQPYS